LIGSTKYFAPLLLLTAIGAPHPVPAQTAKSEKFAPESSALYSKLHIHASGQNAVLASNVPQPPSKKKASQILLIQMDNPDNAVDLGIPSNDLMHAEFSQSSPLLLVASKDVDSKTGGSLIGLYSSTSGKKIAENKKLEQLQQIFWMDDCRYAALTAPLVNGGNLRIFTRQDSQKCRSLNAAKQPQKKKKVLRSIWTDSQFNTFAYFSDGSREILDWLGQGRFFDFHHATADTFWFREAERPGVLIYAKLATKKIQPIGVVGEFLSDTTSSRIFTLKKGVLQELRFDAQWAPQMKSLAPFETSERGAQMLWLEPGKTLLLRSAKGRFYTLGL
jgi:hypothetical protein